MLWPWRPGSSYSEEMGINTAKPFGRPPPSQWRLASWEKPLSWFLPCSACWATSGTVLGPELSPFLTLIQIFPGDFVRDITLFKKVMINMVRHLFDIHTHIYLYMYVYIHIYLTHTYIWQKFSVFIIDNQMFWDMYALQNDPVELISMHYFVTFLVWRILKNLPF